MNKKYFVSRIDKHTWAITEKLIIVPTISYLLEGSKSALLIDTGLGRGDLRGVVEKLTSKPVTVVNTHAHIDHFGANSQFDKCCYCEDDIGTYEMNNDPVRLKHMTDMVVPGFIQIAMHRQLKILVEPKPWEASFYVKDGYKFQLGGRLVEAITTPGHTVGSVCLLDHGTGYLFTGSTVCSKNVLLHVDGYGTLPEFLNSMLKLKERESEIKALYPGHYKTPLNKNYIDGYLNCAEGILSGSLKTRKMPLGKMTCKKASYGPVTLKLPPDFRAAPYIARPLPAKKEPVFEMEKLA